MNKISTWPSFTVILRNLVVTCKLATLGRKKPYQVLINSNLSWLRYSAFPDNIFQWTIWASLIQATCACHVSDIYQVQYLNCTQRIQFD